ncbi:MAG: ATP-dependent DNA helicase RecG, partial [Spirochaetota bacterium]
MQRLRGVGPAVAQGLEKLGITAVRDLLLYVPRGYENRKDPAPLAEAFHGRTVNTVAEVLAHDYVGPPDRRTLKVYVRDDTHTASLACFGRNFLARKLPPGRKIYLTGAFQYRFGELTASSFVFEPYGAEPRAFGMILPVYGLTEGITQQGLRKIMRTALADARHIEDEVPDALRRRHALLPRRQAVQAVHFPESMQEAEAARRSLAFDELFVFQAVVARRVMERNAGTRAPK